MSKMSYFDILIQKLSNANSRKPISFSELNSLTNFVAQDSAINTFETKILTTLLNN